jgi:hypothetical protein
MHARTATEPGPSQIFPSLSKNPTLVLIFGHTANLTFSPSCTTFLPSELESRLSNHAPIPTDTPLTLNTLASLSRCRHHLSLRIVGNKDRATFKEEDSTSGKTWVEQRICKRLLAVPFVVRLRSWTARIWEACWRESEHMFSYWMIDF